MRGVSACVAVLLALPLGWGGATGLYVWFSPFILLNSLFTLKSVVWLNGLALLVLIASWLRKRWFCRNLCPVGWVCDQVSACSRRKDFDAGNVPYVGQWLAISSLAAACVGVPLFLVLDPMAIFHGFFSLISVGTNVESVLSLVGLPLLWVLHLRFPGAWCARFCPLGGLQEEVALVGRRLARAMGKENAPAPPENGDRRLLLASVWGGLTGVAFLRLVEADPTSYLRPPASVSPDLFSTLCLRCGNCIQACPTGVLIRHADAADPLSWMVPEISFHNGYCLEKCNQCSRVCPSGAITLFSPEAKPQLPIGLAKVKEGDCLLSRNKECDRCKAACSYKAITITGKKGQPPLPVIHSNTCIGCGACAVICPPEAITIIPRKKKELRLVLYSTILHKTKRRAS